LSVLRQIVRDEPVIFERSSPGKKGAPIRDCDVPLIEPAEVLPKGLLRSAPPELPEVSEFEVVRHFTRLSQWNYGIDTGIYPLGSCTMKYNPKLNEEVAAFEGFSRIHPLQPEETVQGALELIYELEGFLAEITGMDAVSLQPAAGALGELTGLLLMSAYHRKKGSHKTKVIVPDSAHGTNPSSCTLAGYKVIQIPTSGDGVIEPHEVAKVMDEEVAGIMVTNPNTLGIFERHIVEIADIVHEKDGLVYCDGANLNALMGVVKLGETGVDVMHINLHKTFSTPHGGGGPGAGPVAVKKNLAPYLPVPSVIKGQDGFHFDYDRPDSIGRVMAFYGNFGVLVRAYTYILSLGPEGLDKCTKTAVLNSNYIREKLRGHYHLPYSTPTLHECIFTDKKQRKLGVSTLDIAKRLIDYGYHPPTIYFPLVVQGAMMVEPTESESLDELDGFIGAMIEVAKEAETNPEILKTAPHSTPVGRLDEVRAVKKPKLRWLRNGDNS